MGRPFDRRQARENAAFLRILAETGNARLAARSCGLHRGTLEKRRRAHPDFATQWEAALEAADKALNAGAAPASVFTAAQALGRRTTARALRTRGGEPVLVRTAAGRLQLRAALPGTMSRAALDRVLDIVAAGGSLRTAADCVGLAHSSLVARGRRDPAFADELAVLREIAQQRRRFAELERARQAADHDFDADRPIPPMTGEQMLHQLALHRRAVTERRPFHRRRPPRKWEDVRPRIAATMVAFARQRHFEETGRWRYPDEEPEEAMLGPQATPPPPPEPPIKRPRTRRASRPAPSAQRSDR